MMATRKEHIEAIEKQLKKLKAAERESNRKKRAAAERAARHEMPDSLREKAAGAIIFDPTSAGL
jgi:predicted phage tail protein